MIDPAKFLQSQTRVLVLVRVNADPYDPDEWWIDKPEQGYRSLLYRFRVGDANSSPQPGVVLLPSEAAHRAAVMYEALCPSFREDVRRLFLSDGQTVVAFTQADTPTREEVPSASRRTVTLYPGSPLLEQNKTGFDVLKQLGEDVDALIRFEAADGYRTLVQLFCRYNLQFGGAGQVNLPRQLTEENELSTGVAACVLDALFTPGAIYRLPADAEQILRAATADLKVQGEYQQLTRKVKDPVTKIERQVKELFLAAAVADFRRVCATPGAAALRPLDPALLRVANRQAANTADIVDNLTKFLKLFQDARAAFNRAAQVLQSNILLGSVADWLLAGGVSQVENPVSFAEITQTTFTRGVGASRSMAVSAALRQKARERFLARLERDLTDVHARQRIARMYELAEPYLCSLPTFRVREVEEIARTKAVLLLDEALAVGNPAAMESIRRSGEKAGLELRKLLQNNGRLQNHLPGVNFNALELRVGLEGRQLVAKLSGDTVSLSGQFSDDNVTQLFAEAAAQGSDIANAVYQAFYHAENTLPDDNLVKLDDVLNPLLNGLRAADERLLRENHDLRQGFAAGSLAVSGTALALGETDPRPTGGDVWTRISAESPRIALTTTGVRNTSRLELPYNALLGGRTPEATDPHAGLEAGLLALIDDALAFARAPEKQADQAAALRQRLTVSRGAVEQLDKDERTGRWSALLEQIEAALTDVPPDGVADQLAAGRNWLFALHEQAHPPAPLTTQAEPAALKHYFDGRSRILKHYGTVAANPDNSFAGRTRYVWLTQLVMHVHSRLPMAEGRADLGNLCGMLLELAEHWHEAKDAEQVRKDFYAANAGGLNRYFPAQTLDHVRSLARGYHDRNAESCRTLRDLRVDLKGLEELLAGLPAGAEVIVLNMTADDFVALDWSLFPDLFDAFNLQRGPQESLIPQALLVTRSAQRWTPATADEGLRKFLSDLDQKVHPTSHTGRCVVPPVLVAADSPEPPASTAARAVQGYRNAALAQVQELAGRLEEIQPDLCFPVFAVGVPARLQAPPVPSAPYLESSPYLVLGRLCGTIDDRDLFVEGNLGAPPTSRLALPFTVSGTAKVRSLIERWLAENPSRDLAAALFGWWVSLVFRSEVNANDALQLPLPSGGVSAPGLAAVRNFWVLFLRPWENLNDPQKNFLRNFNEGYFDRAPDPGDRRERRFGNWAFAPLETPTGDHWKDITTRAVVRRNNVTTELGWFRRLLKKIYP